MAVAQRLHRGFDDVLGGAEVRLADAEADDVAALRRQRLSAGEHRKRIFLTDAVERRDRLQHGPAPSIFGGSSTDRQAKIKPDPPVQASRSGVASGRLAVPVNCM